MKKEELYNKFLVTVEAGQEDFMSDELKLNSAKLALHIGGKLMMNDLLECQGLTRMNTRKLHRK